MVTFIEKTIYKAREWKKKLGYKNPYLHIGLALLLLFIGFVIGQSIADLTDFIITRKITAPIKNWVEPPVSSVRFDPIPDPIKIDDEKSRIKVNVVNNGTKDLNNIRIFYSMKCVMDKPQSAVLSQHTFLAPEMEDYFKFRVSNFSQDCNPYPYIATIKFYKDIDGTLYSETVYNIEKVCQWCRLEINFTSDEYKTSFVDYYPYYDSEFDF